MDLNRIALPLAALVFLLLAMVVPSLRLYRRTGTVAVTFQRNADPRQRIIGALFGLTLLGVLGGAVLFGIIGPVRMSISPAPMWLTALGWIAMALGLGIVLLAQIQMGNSWRIGIDESRTELVTSGLFQFVRNPIFSAMLLMAAGMTAVMPSLPGVLVWLFMAALVRMQCHFEERHLLALHGEVYRAYASRVGRLIPGVGRLRGDI